MGIITFNLPTHALAYQGITCSAFEYQNIVSSYPDIGNVKQQIIMLSEQLIQLQQNAVLIPIEANQSAQGTGATTGGMQPIINGELTLNSNNIATTTIALENAQQHLNAELGLIDEQCESIGQQDYKNKQVSQKTETPTLVYQLPTTTESVLPIDFIASCEQQLGPNGIVTGQNSCGCATGYILNGSGTQCIQNLANAPTAPSQTLAEPNTPVASNPAPTATTPTKTAPSGVISIFGAPATNTASSTPALTANATTTSQASVVHKIWSWLVSLW